MTPNTALWILLAVAIFGAAVGAPLAFALRQEIARAKTTISNYTAVGLTIFLLNWVALGLWWYYALSTNQVLLAVIPTVVIVWSWVLRLVMRATR